MASAIHLICGHDARNQPDNVVFDSVGRAFWSGNWNLTQAEAESLVGGWLYLHVTKSERSYYGGLIAEFAWVEIAGVTRRQRIRFRFQPSVKGKRVPWRGSAQGRAWTGGVIDGTHPHERDA